MAKKAIVLLPDVELLLYMRADDNALQCGRCFFNDFTDRKFSASNQGSYGYGCPIVSVDVGDVAERIAGFDGCYIVEWTTNDVTEKLRQALEFGKCTEGTITGKLISV